MNHRQIVILKAYADFIGTVNESINDDIHTFVSKAIKTQWITFDSLVAELQQLKNLALYNSRMII